MDETVSTRLATIEDADAIEELTRQAYAKWIGLIGREPTPMQADYPQALRKHRFDLLYVGGTLAGLIETVPDGHCILIENVAVRPIFQGRGLGKLLLTLADSLAASAGLSGVRLYTNALFAKNIAIYEKFGYIREKEISNALGTAIHMMKPCSVPACVSSALPVTD